MGQALPAMQVVPCAPPPFPLPVRAGGERFGKEEGEGLSVTTRDTKRMECSSVGRQGRRA